MNQICEGVILTKFLFQLVVTKAANVQPISQFQPFLPFWTVFWSIFKDTYCWQQIDFYIKKQQQHSTFIYFA